MTTETKQAFYKNGKIRSEVTLVNGVPHGVTRFWHENGQLSRELAVHNGVSYQWDSSGKLLGSYEMRDGNGFYREWHENGVMSLEIPYVKGLQHGSAKSWDTPLDEGDRPHACSA